ncbi:hypothetical protein [Streptomyces sp. NRRL B-24572]|uniref:hypothetical protein n=1 Tax=Streptomyces sp. NRRL B-24572 TaxID=1962156 RepID=UPI00117BE596|nr:hypothetical protein [Streptomyces sp. NRRL B-24572]
MLSDPRAGAPVTKRGNRFVTGGCLTILTVLILLLGVTVSWLWYSSSHNRQTTRENEEKALTSILSQADRTADASGRALQTSGTTRADVLTGLIWKHTEAPVIRYDVAHGGFTALVEKAVEYETVGFYGARTARMVRCLAFTYTPGHGGTWTSQVTVKGSDTCRASNEIRNVAREARTRLARMSGEALTAGGIQQELDPAGRPDLLTVHGVTREGRTVSVSATISSWDGTVNQCYRLTRPISGSKAENSTIAAPAASC